FRAGALGNFVVDRFTQRITPPRGTEKLWSHAVLVDASDDKLLPLAQHYARAVREERTTVAHDALAVAGLLAVIALVYVFLNAVTKGYFTTRLRVGAVLLGAAA